jgi:molybdate-binding protein
LLSADKREGNVDAVRAALGSRFSLLRIARWQEGLTMAPGLTARSCAALLRQPRVRWIGREQGSGARQCLEEALAGRPVPRRTAHDHRGVVEAIRNGWADVGVCLRLPSVEAGLRYLPVREEDYDLCIPDEFADDPRVTAFIGLVRSERYRRLAGELPGYDTRQTGEIQHVKLQA